MASKAPESFADLIESAQRLPEEPLSHSGIEVTSPFDNKKKLPRNQRVVDTTTATSGQIPGLVEYDYESHMEVFCLNKDADRAEYTNTINDILSGKGFLRYEDRTWTKEGDLMVGLCWFTAKPKAKSKLASLRPSKPMSDSDDDG